MRISEFALRMGKTLGLTEAQVQQMATHAAPYTTQDWNRRYESYVFQIDDGEVTDMGLLAGEAASDCKPDLYDCPHCDGEGCYACKHTGDFVGTPDQYEKECVEAKL